MQPLTLDDLLPLPEYVEQRSEFFAAHVRYLDRYRRVRVGPSLTLLFENRQTLWFRVQEILRVARLSEPERIQLELDWYNQFLPTRDRLQAALLIAIPDSERMMAELRFWSRFQGSDLTLHLDRHRVASELITARENDLSIGMAHWVEFPLLGSERELFADRRRPIRICVNYQTYVHESAPLSEDIRQSLWDDLTLSDRDPV